MDGQKQKDLKARKKSPVLEPYDGYLNTLIDFLNFDAFDPIQRKHVAESHQLYRITFRDSPERLKEIREYVLSDVAAITELPRKNAKPDEKETYAIKLDIHLRKLFDRLVRLVSPKPDILSGQPKVRLDNSYIFDQATRKIRTGEPVAYLWDTVARNPASDFLTHEQKKFEWGEGKWIFKVDFSLTRSPQHFETDIPQVELYQLILKGLIDGELAKLRRCTICRTFFVRDDFPNQINCDEHKGMVDRSETKEAKRKSRNDTATVALRKMKQYINGQSESNPWCCGSAS